LGFFISFQKIKTAGAYGTFIFIQRIQTSNFKLQTSNLKPQTLNLKPQTSNLKLQTLNLKPSSKYPSAIPSISL